jgi:hypothetical protein
MEGNYFAPCFNSLQRSIKILHVFFVSIFNVSRIVGHSLTECVDQDLARTVLFVHFGFHVRCHMLKHCLGAKLAQNLSPAANFHLVLVYSCIM